MSDAAHNYSRGDRAALILFGNGKCYWPGCHEPLLKAVNKSYKIALEIAHIKAAKPGGERYVPDMSDTDRAAFDNIIFLCVAHHKAVDETGAEKEYSIEKLQQWKSGREQGAPEQLRGLREVTEDKLVTMIATAVKERDIDFTETLQRLDKSDRDAADLLRELHSTLDALTDSQPILNPGLVDELSQAAYRLTHLEESAASIREAAHELRNLEDHAATLRNAASSLGAIHAYSESLNETVHRLGGFVAQLEDLAPQFRRSRHE